MTEQTSTDIDLTELRSDGDTIELEDGRSLRLQIETDQDASINDYESDGKIEWARSGYGHTRPDGFTGRARIIEWDYPHVLWWEPYSELTDEQIKAEQPRIRELARFGFHSVILELLDGEDAYGRPIVVESTSLGGVDSVDPQYLLEIVGELASELGLSQ